MTSDSLPLDASPRRSALARIVPFALYIVFLAAGGTLAGWLDMDARWMYALQIASVIVALLYFRSDYIELLAVRDATAAPLSGASGWLVALGLGVAVWALWIWLDFSPFAFEPGKGYAPLDEGGALIMALVVVRIFGAAVVVPVMEELFWRSFIMRWLDNPDFTRLSAAAASWRAILLSSVVFGIEHHQWLAGVLAGLAYGGLYMRSNTLWSPILAHAVTNLLLGLWVLRTGAWHFW